MSSPKESLMLDLVAIFKELKTETYAIIKLPDSFPQYGIRSDIDIFCLDLKRVSEKIVAMLQPYITQTVEIRVKINENHMYIDVLDEGKIHFRFDLYGSMPEYKNIHIKESFFPSVLEYAQTKYLSEYELDIKVPSDMDEGILRYIEYQEWYVLRPDKIKHIDYIEALFRDKKVMREALLERLHYYTALPKVFEKRMLKTKKCHALELFKQLLRCIFRKK